MQKLNLNDIINEDFKFCKHPDHEGNRKLHKNLFYTDDNYYCKRCRNRMKQEYRNSSKTEKIKSFWFYHNKIYDTLAENNGALDYKFFPKGLWGNFADFDITAFSYVHSVLRLNLSPLIFTTQIDKRSRQLYHSVYNTLYKPIPWPTPDEWQQWLKLTFFFNITKQCKKCKKWKITYYPKVQLTDLLTQIFRSSKRERFAMEHTGNFKRTYQNDSGWNHLCNECSKSKSKKLITSPSFPVPPETKPELPLPLPSEELEKLDDTPFDYLT